MVQAHAWWRLKGLAVDLVIWNEERDVYRQRLQEQILGLITSSTEFARGRSARRHLRAARGADCGRRTACCCNPRRAPSSATASARWANRLVPSVHRSVASGSCSRGAPSSRRPSRRHPRSRAVCCSSTAIGGYSPDGREYVIETSADKRPPAPWVTVIANPRFGTIVSEGGSGYTWCENAHELRLTPWHNDPITDSGGEVIYLRDEETGQTWSPTSLPSPSELRGRKRVRTLRHATRLRGTACSSTTRLESTVNSRSSSPSTRQ